MVRLLSTLRFNVYVQLLSFILVKEKSVKSKVEEGSEAKNV